MGFEFQKLFLSTGIDLFIPRAHRGSDFEKYTFGTKLGICPGLVVRASNMVLARI